MNPLKTTEFGLAIHKRSHFHAVLPADCENPEDPRLWTGVAAQLKVGDVIDFVADDMSFAGSMIVTHRVSQQCLVKITHAVDLNEQGEEQEILKPVEAPFFIESRGQKKYCLIERATGKVIKENIKDKATAERDLADYEKALRS